MKRSQREAAAMFAAQAARDGGAASAFAATPVEWQMASQRGLRELIRRGGRFNADDLRELAGDPPGHHNAMGHVFLDAKRHGYIRDAGRSYAARQVANRRNVAVYEATSQGGRWAAMFADEDARIGGPAS